MTLPAAHTPPPRSVQRLLLDELMVWVAVAVAIASVLALVGGQFWLHLVYSACIGLCIQTGIEGGRYGFSAWIRRRWPDHPAGANHWPGWWVMAPWLVICSGLGYWAGANLADALTGLHHALSLWSANWRVLGVVLCLSLGVSAAATYYSYAQSVIALTEAKAEAARRVAAENQLMLLQSQLEPHMLFNTLANLRVLISLDPPKAQAMLDHLIGFLRSTLSASRSATHPLQSEFDRVADYLALMQVRMGSRLQTRLELPDSLQTWAVPPLLLQPLVENAILHGLEPKVEGGRITLKAWADEQALHLEVRDTGVGLGQATAPGGTGFGTQQVRQRLATQYGPSAGLTVTAAADAEGGTVAHIHLPLTPPQIGQAPAP